MKTKEAIRFYKYLMFRSDSDLMIVIATMGMLRTLELK